MPFGDRSKGLESIEKSFAAGREVVGSLLTCEGDCRVVVGGTVDGAKTSFLYGAVWAICGNERYCRFIVVVRKQTTRRLRHRMVFDRFEDSVELSFLGFNGVHDYVWKRNSSSMAKE